MKPRPPSPQNVARFPGREPEADRFDAVIGPHFDALYAAAYRLTTSRADAEDLVQEVCIKAFTRLDEVARLEHPKAWLLKVMYNQFIDGQRQRQRSPVGLSETGEESEDAEPVADRHWQPDELLDRELTIDAIRRAMKLLDREQCALVALHDMEGMTVGELAELTGLPEGTIKSQLHRTRVRLGRLLATRDKTLPDLRVIGGGQ